MNSFARFILVAMAMLILAACGSVPQPFRGTAKVTHDNPLLDVPAATGVAILPMSGVSAELSDAYTKTVAERLDAMEVPAAAVPKAGSLGFIVSGAASNVVEGATGESLDVAWTIKSRHGSIVGHFVQSIRISPGEGGNRLAAAATARSIAYHMGLGGEPTPAAVPTPPAPVLPSVSVKPVEGAHGDGRTSLTLAVLQALTDAGVRRDDVNPDVILYGKVETRPATFETQSVTISWRAVLRDGRELGTMKLDNDIPIGALDSAWGPTAFSIAGAAQKDLVRLITSAPPQAESPAAPPATAKPPRTRKKP